MRKKTAETKHNESGSWEIDFFQYNFSIENQRSCQKWQSKSKK